jgi:hypothetical protein
MMRPGQLWLNRLICLDPVLLKQLDDRAPHELGASQVLLLADAIDPVQDLRWYPEGCELV